MTRNERQLKAVEQEMERYSQEAQAIWAKADEDDRDTTHEERGEVESKLKAIDTLKERKSELEAAIKVESDTIALGRKIGAEESPHTDGEPKPATRLSSLGKQFVESEGYKSLSTKGMTGNWSTGEVRLKTTLTEGDNWDADSGTPGPGAPLVGVDQRPGVLPTLFQPLTIADLLGSATTTSNLIRYVVESTATNAADTVAEGGDKPESALSFDMAETPVRKIATFLPVSDEMLEDASQIQSYINQRLALFVRQTEEDQLLNGQGSGQDLNGLLNQVPGPNQDIASDADAVNAADHIYAAITVVRDSYLEPDAVVIHPDDWAALRLLKDQNENYIGGSPFSNTGSNPNETLWGKRVVVTNVIDAGSALVGAFGTAATVWRRGGLTVEASNSHASYFVKNLTAIRAEERLALSVARPEAFATADLTAS